MKSCFKNAFAIICFFAFSSSFMVIGEEGLPDLDKLTPIDCVYHETPEEIFSKRHQRLPMLPGTDVVQKNNDLFNKSFSLNWSGYIAGTSLTAPKAGSVTLVSGMWRVPKVSKDKLSTYSSIWVGIDGYTSSTVEQIGTEHDWAGKQQHYAWFEMYPGPSYYINGFPVAPNDLIGAQVRYLGHNVYELTIANYTKKVKHVVPATHTHSSRGKRSSAEWVVEAPSSYSGILPFAHISKVTMSNCHATIQGHYGTISDKHWKHDSLTMASVNNQVKAAPSSLLSNGSEFSVTWKHN